MTEREPNTDNDRLATLTATVDQLQAEVNGHEKIIALLVGVAIGTCILVVMLEAKLRRLETCLT